MSRRQPESARFTSNKIVRNLFVAYLFQRISLTMSPRRILYWPHRDFSKEPQVIELDIEEEASCSTITTNAWKDCASS